MNDIIQYVLSKNGKIVLLPTSFHKVNNCSNDYLFLKKYADKYKLEIAKNM
jgi:hypothetical protein